MRIVKKVKNLAIVFIVLLYFYPSYLFAQTFEWEWLLVRESQEIGGAPTGMVYLYIYNQFGVRFDYSIAEDGDGNLTVIDTKDYKDWNVPVSALGAAKTYRTEEGWIYYIIKSINRYKI